MAAAATTPLLFFSALALAALLALPRAAALGVAGSSAASRLMSNLIVTANGKQHAGMFPYSGSNSPKAIADLKAGANIVSISTIPFSVQQENYFPKLTMPVAIATYSLFTKSQIVASLNPAQVASIMLGRVRSWSQAPGSKSKASIIFAARADPSGTTAIVTKYLQEQLKGWPKGLVGTGPFAFGPTTVGKHGHEALLDYIHSTPNAVGWLESATGRTSGLYEIALPTFYGKPVTSKTGTVYDALTGALFSYPPLASFSFAKVSLSSNKGVNSYPVVSFVYAFASPDMRPWKKAGLTHRDFLLYTQTVTCQALVKALGLNPLKSGKVIAINRAAMHGIKVVAGKSSFVLPP